MKKALTSAVASVFLLVSLSGCVVINRSDPAPTAEPAPEVTATPAPVTPMLPEQFTPGNGMPANEAAAAKALALTYLPIYKDAVCSLSVSPDQTQAGIDAFNGLIASVNADPVVAGTSTGAEFVSGLQKFSQGLTMVSDSGMAMPPEFVSLLTDSCTQATDILAKVPTT